MFSSYRLVGAACAVLIIGRDALSIAAQLLHAARGTIALRCERRNKAFWNDTVAVGVLMSAAVDSGACRREVADGVHQKAAWRTDETQDFASQN